MAKYRLTPQEQMLVVEGLGALARENQMLAAHARRLGDPGLASAFTSRAVEASALSALAESVDIERITVKHDDVVTFTYVR